MTKEEAKKWVEGYFEEMGLMAALADPITEIIDEIDEQKWHTGEPTEEGEYIVEFPNGTHSFVKLEYCEHFGDLRFVHSDDFIQDGRVVSIVHYVYPTSVTAWQKIEPFKERV